MTDKSHLERLLQSRLDDRKTKDLYRSLGHAGNLIDFCSNDYLGLARNTSLHTHNITSPAGSTGSRLISGNSHKAEQAEETIARFHNAEAALIFNTGYMANLGLLSAIADRHDTIIMDAHVHASLIDGAQLSQASKFKFRHNDTNDLEQKLGKAKGNIFVVVESLYSMDGDMAPLEEIVRVCRLYKAFLIVDEAHATGVWGEHGKGLVHQYKLDKEVSACIHTFGKAMGLHGAAITCSAAMKAYLINFARPFIYSTALPPHSYEQIHQVYLALTGIDRSKLFEIIQYFKSFIIQFENISFINSASQIQGVIVGDNIKARALSEHLATRGIHAKAILSPTVAPGTERIRICLHSFNTTDEVDLLINEINQFMS